MRNLLLVVVLIIASRALASDESLIHMGEEIDYVGSAIGLLPEIELPPQRMLNATGTRWDGTEQELFGWYVRRVEPSRNSMVPSWLSLQLDEVLKKNGWSTSIVPITPSGDGTPVQFFAEAQKGEARLVILITIFTAEDGVVRISYSQRRKQKDKA